MIRRLTVIAAVFIFLIAAMPAFAGQLFDEQKAKDDALNNSGQYYEKESQKGKLNYVSIPIISNFLKGDSYYGCFVYGDPHGDFKNGQYRYLGYTFSGEDYTNVACPPDVSHTGYFEDQQWNKKPWRDPDVTSNYPNIDPNNGLDGTDKYELNIFHGIMVYYSDTNNANNYKVKGVIPQTKEFWSNIQQYVHILAPPTKYAWGIGRMWRKNDSGGLNYITVPLMPCSLLPELGNLKAVSLDLGIPAGQKAVYGDEYAFKAVFENESDQAYAEVPVAVLHGDYQATLYDENGQELPKKTINGKEVYVVDIDKKGTSGASIVIHGVWHPFARAVDGLEGIINHDKIERAYLEKTYEDNIVKAEVSVDLLDLYVKSIDPGTDEATTGTTYHGKVTFGLKPYDNAVQAKLILTHNDYPVSPVNGQVVEFQPGQEETYTFTYHGQNKDSRLFARIEPVENGDKDWSNNEYWVEIPLLVEPPPVKGHLKITAVSQDRTMHRPTGEAKWTDWVTVKLRPDAPTPPRGSLDWWKITESKLTYPKKNPEFVFGNPLPSQGTVTVNMNIGTGGHESKVEIKEDWGMDGARIYNPITEELMAENSKSYPISVSYKIKYQYHYVVHTAYGSHIVTKIKTISESESDDIKVTGTGVNSRGQ